MSLVITAADVKKLRDITLAGMSDCKKALEATNGDIEEAIDYLRKLGQKFAVKRADREAKEGVCMAVVSHNRNNGIVFKLTSETDFVAKNVEFTTLANSIAEVAIKHLPNTAEELLALEAEPGMTVNEKILGKLGTFGEKVEVVEYSIIRTEAGEGQVVPYIHMGNRAAVIVALNQEGTDKMEAGKNVAMQIAAMKPIAVSSTEVAPETIERERAIIIDSMKADPKMAGKPEEMIAKIAEGKLNSFFKESTLLSQDYVKDGSKNVAAYLESVSKGLTVSAFKHIKLG